MARERPSFPDNPDPNRRPKDSRRQIPEDRQRQKQHEVRIKHPEATHADPIALCADGIARRLTQESIRPLPVSFDSHARLINGYLQDPELPSHETYVKDIIEATDIAACRRRLARDLRRNVNEISDDAVRELLWLPNRIITELLPDPPFATMAQHLPEAQALAEEHDVSSDEVFTNQKLFAAFARQITSPQEIAENLIATLDRMNPIKIQKTLREINIRIAQLAEGDHAYAIIDEFLDHANSPQEIGETDQYISELRDEFRLKRLDLIKRFWGNDGIRQLSPEILDRLGIEKPPSDIALAIIERDNRENQWLERTTPMTDVSFERHHAPIDIRHKANVLDHFWENPDMFPTTRSWKETFSDHVAQRETADGTITEPKPISLRESAALTSERMEMLAKARGKAEELAQQLSIPAALVYQDDEIYEELIRRIYETPEAYVQTKLAQLPQFAPEQLTRLRINAEIEHITDTEHRARMEQDRQAYYDTPHMKEAVKSKSRQLKTTFIAATQNEVARFWGHDALRKLRERATS